MMYFQEPAQQQTPLYIFDLDGTLALIDHRRYLVEKPEDGTCRDCIDGKALRPVAEGIDCCPTCGGSGKFVPDWNGFFELCHLDQPNWPVIGTMLQLYSVGCDIRLWSARSDAVKQKTLMWLHQSTRIPLIKLEQMLKMRPQEDISTPDEQLKLKWLNTMGKQERSRVAAVYDDRDKVVAMWRRVGVACFQVAPGEF